MTSEDSTAGPTDTEVVPTVLPAALRARIFIYLGLLIVLLSFGAPSGGLIDIPISFFLKNRLHLAAHETAAFRLVAGLPLYLSFAFGFIRDTWNPFGMKDRGFMAIFGALSAALYAAFAFLPLTYLTLLAAMVLLTASFLFVSSAQNGLKVAADVCQGITAVVITTLVGWAVIGFIKTPTRTEQIVGSSATLAHAAGGSKEAPMQA